MVDPVLPLVAIAVAGLTPSAAVLALRQRDALRWSADLVAYRIDVTTAYEPIQLQRFLSSASGLLPSRWDRPMTVRGFGFEVVAEADEIHFYALVPRHQEETFSGQFRGAVPGARLTPDPDYRPRPVALATELVTTQPHRQLGVERPETATTGVLAALQPLREGERLVLQYLLFPLPRSTRPPAEAGNVWSRLTNGTPAPQPDRAVLNKYSQAMFTANVRLGVTGAGPARNRQLMARLVAGFHGSHSAEASLRRRAISSRRARRALMQRRAPVLGRTCLLNAAELSGLVPLPSRSVNVPGLRFGGLALLPSKDIPRTGCWVLADSTYGQSRPLAISLADTYRHVHIVGPTGGGKTTLVKNMFRQDAVAGYGIVCILRKGDEDEFLNLLPPERLDDVAIMDPADDSPVGLGLWGSGDEPTELVAERILSILHDLFRDTWGVWTEDTLRGCLLTLATRRDLTLIEVPLLLSDAAFRRSVVEQIDDPIGLGGFWRAFENLSDGQRTQVTGPLLNRLRAVLVRPRMRHLLGQASPRLDLDRIFTNQTILIVPLSDVVLGADAARLVASLLLARLWQAVQLRAHVAPADRRPVHLFLDEFQDFTALPLPLEQMAAQARSLDVGLVLSHQHLDQLPRDLREALLANARSRVVFQTSATDAARLAREMTNVAADDLQRLDRFEVVMSLSCGNYVAPPVTGRTRPEDPSTGLAEAARAASRARFGRPRSEIEAELRLRHDRPTPTGSVGRQRRPS